jgi:hypothetical protein
MMRPEQLLALGHCLSLILLAYQAGQAVAYRVAFGTWR